MQKLPFTFTKRNILFLLICISGITMLVLICILPLPAKDHNLSEELPIVQAKIKSQQDMVTVLAAFDSRLSQLGKITNLPDVTLKSLPITESNKVITDITELTNRLQLTEPEVSAIMPKSGINLKEIFFSAAATGDLSHIRSFIFSLLQIPYVGKIRQVEIETAENSLIVKLIFTVRLS